MKIKLIILSLIISLAVNAQKGIVVDYKKMHKDTIENKFKFYGTKLRTVITDSAYYYTAYTTKRSLKKIITPYYGSNMSHHAVYIDRITMKAEHNLKRGNSDRIWYYDLNQDIWTKVDETKTILGKKCKKATYSDKRGNFIAWYCEEYNYPFSENGCYTNLPGLILEHEWLENNSKVTAINITFSDNIVIKPLQVGKRINTEEFRNDK